MLWPPRLEASRVAAPPRFPDAPPVFRAGGLEAGGRTWGALPPGRAPAGRSPTPPGRPAGLPAPGLAPAGGEGRWPGRTPCGARAADGFAPGFVVPRPAGAFQVPELPVRPRAFAPLMLAWLTLTFVLRLTLMSPPPQLKSLWLLAHTAPMARPTPHDRRPTAAVPGGYT